MARRKILLLFGLLAPLSLVVGQEQSNLETSTYESFFRAVRQQKSAEGPVLLNGQPSKLMRPSVQAALGLTDGETQALSAAAGDCATKSLALEREMKSLVFQSRLSAIASEAPSASVSQRLKELERQRTQMVIDHIEQLRLGLGESTFQTVESYINSRKDSQSFFPLASTDPSRPVAVPRKRAVSR